MKDLNVYGFFTGLVAFLLTGLFHPLVVWIEYHFGKRAWRVLFFSGILSVVLSLFCRNNLWSIFLGVLGFALFWSAWELNEQHNRVIKRNSNNKEK